MFGSYPQAIRRLKCKLKRGANLEEPSGISEEFLVDSRLNDSIWICMVSYLRSSFKNTRNNEQFLFMNRDATQVHVGFGRCGAASAVGTHPVFIAGSFSGERDVKYTPRIHLKTDIHSWPRVSISVYLSECESKESVCSIVDLLDMIDDTFIPIESSYQIPPCLSYSDTGMDKKEYVKALNDAFCMMEASELQKVVFSRRVSFKMACGFNGYALLQEIMKQSESDSGKRYICAYHDGNDMFISMTPERLCYVDHQLLETEALAGTCPSSKENFEMSNKLSNEHGTVSEYILDKLDCLGSSFPAKITDREFLRLRDMIHCRQRFQKITDRLSGKELVDWSLDYLHPTPAVCGLPMLKSKQLILEKERFDRSFFSGPFGVYDSRNRFGEICVALRSATITGNLVHVYAGAGIVRGSDADQEWDEMDLKMNQYRSVLLGSSRPIFTNSLTNATNVFFSFMIEECVRSGITSYIICPGSRSTPLVVSINANSVSRSQSIVVHDERSAGFYAIGIARGGGYPCIVVTSGTAVSNLLPAVTEAREAGLPMLLLTADRPSHSWDVGEYQTIKQSGIFSSLVGYSKNFSCCVSEAISHLCSNLLPSMLADVSFGVGEMMRNRNHIVHLNCEIMKSELQPIEIVEGFSRNWRKRLSPKLENYCETVQPYTVHIQSKFRCKFPEIETAKVLIICGELRNPKDSISLSFFCRNRKIPCIAEPMSMMMPCDYIMMGSDQVLGNEQIREILGRHVETIIRLGGPLVSARLQDWHMQNCQTIRVVDDAFSPTRHDPQWRVDTYIHSNITDFLLALECKVFGPPDQSFLRITRVLNQAYSEIPPELPFNEMSIASTVGKYSDAVFLSSSMPCRDFSIYGAFHSQQTWSYRLVGCNRGANGIDGVISSAAGYSTATCMPVTLLIGDVATLHDIGGLAIALNSQPGNYRKYHTVKVVCVNNSGGGIFSFLPIKNHHEVFSPYFDTPHAVNFSQIADGIRQGSSSRVKTEKELIEAIHKDGISLIECTDLPTHEQNVQIHKDFGYLVIKKILDE